MKELKLTDKTLEDFYKYVYYNEDTTQVNETSINDIIDEARCFLYNQDDILRTALVVEWLNTLKYMGANLFLTVFEKLFAVKASFMDFNDIVQQSIEICNKVYNAQSKG